MFGIFGNKEIQISIGNGLTQEFAHGVLWARPIDQSGETPIAEAINVGYQAVNFRADRPEHLAKPGRATIRSIYEQAKLLGLELTHVELRVGGEPRFYAQQ